MEKADSENEPGKHKEALDAGDEARRFPRIRHGSDAGRHGHASDEPAAKDAPKAVPGYLVTFKLEALVPGVEVPGEAAPEARALLGMLKRARRLC